MNRARGNELDTENHMSLVASREAGRLKQEIQRLENDLADIKERRNIHEVNYLEFPSFFLFLRFLQLLPTVIWVFFIKTNMLSYFVCNFHTHWLKPWLNFIELLRDTGHYW